MRSGHPNARTYGSKLRGRILDPDEAKPAFPVTTRMCDIEHYNRTGEVRYLDDKEAEKDMPTFEQRENTKRLWEEITSIAQFEAIGRCKDVVEKYNVADNTVRKLLKSLRDKKVQEEATLNETRDTQEPLNRKPTGLDTTASEIQALGKSELQPPKESENTGCQPDKPCSECPEVLSVTFCRECGDILVHSKDLEICKDCVAAKQGQEPLLSDETIDQLEADIEKLSSIEAMWDVVESDLEVIRKLYMEMAEREFAERCQKTLARITAC